MDKYRDLWNSRYARVLRGERVINADPWLLSWLDAAPLGAPRRALDIGCGCGHNAKLLSDKGFEVTAVDICDIALQICRQKAPEASVQWADVREGLPFPSCRFHVIVADLSLHYSKWDATVAMTREISRCLVHKGLFAGRFNSTKDVNHGAGAGEPIDGEPNMFFISGSEKRFFTQRCLQSLFASPWDLVAVDEKAVQRSVKQKVLWEVVAVNGNSSLHEPTPAAEVGKPRG
jgi:SAM-dependent methyltransferase